MMRNYSTSMAIPALDPSSEEDSYDVESPGDSSTLQDSEVFVEQDRDKGSQQDDIGGQDSVGVSRWRGMVVVMLLLTASLVITTTYIFLSREETDEFEKSVRFCMLRIMEGVTAAISASKTNTFAFMLRTVHTKFKYSQGRSAFLRSQFNEFAPGSGRHYRFRGTSSG
jgi:hypothetical protein